MRNVQYIERVFVRLNERNKLESVQTVVVGDRDLDISGGRNAGLTTYLFNSNNLETNNIKSDYIEEDLRLLLDLIEKPE